MRNLKENSNIIKTFMTRGAEHFYLPYYLDGDEFIKQIHVPNKEVREVVNLADECLEDEILDLELGEELETDTVKHFCQRFVLNGLLDFRKDEPTGNDLSLYQYIADIIVGQPNIMLKMVADIAENGEIDEETIEEAEFNVYHAILEMIMNINRQAEFADETEVC
jgi:hypothetical protein